MHAFELRLRGSPPRSCPVRAGRGAIDRLVRELVDRPPGRPLVLISDSRVGPLHAEPLADRLRRAGIDTHVLAFPEGERHKTRETKAGLEDRLGELGIGRDGAVVAVGGGVVGDLAGFVAATWHRGIPVVQVPTSLLAMVDAALGGKTAVDLPGGKNLVGAFHQPWGVWADTATLDTLDDRHYRAGFAEVVKSAVVADARLFRWLEGSAPDLRRRDRDAVDHVVAACLRIKGRVVARDERDTGRRAILNFGHTVGHAVEAASGWAVGHGDAVALGMVVEARLASAVAGLPPAHGVRIEKLLAAFGVGARWPAGVAVDDVVSATARDKKVRDAAVRYALPLRIGRMRPGTAVTETLDPGRLREALHALASAGGDGDASGADARD